MKKNGQSSIEFFALCGFLLFFVVFFLGVIGYRYSVESDLKTNDAFYQTALTIKSEIDLAYESIDGYERVFILPDKIAGKDYVVFSYYNMVFLKSSDSKISLGIPTKNHTGNINPGQNIIRKKDGVVRIN